MAIMFHNEFLIFGECGVVAGGRGLRTEVREFSSSVESLVVGGRKLRTEPDHSGYIGY